MPDRVAYLVEQSSPTVNSTVTYTMAIEHTFTPDADSRYLVLATGTLSGASTTVNTRAQLQNTTTADVLGQIILRPKDPLDFYPVAMSAILTFGASPVAQTIQMQVSTGTASTNATLRESTLAIIKLDAADEAVSVDGPLSTTSGTYADVATLTFTPPTAGDYLLIAVAETINASNGDPWNVRLFDTTASASYGETYTASPAEDMYRPAAGSFMAWGTLAKVTLGATAQTFKVQHRNRVALGDTITTRKARIVALRLSQFPAHYYAEARARITSTTATAWVDAVTLTASPAVTPHILLATSQTTYTIATSSGQMQLVDNGVTRFEGSIESRTPRDVWPVLKVFSTTPVASGSRTWQLQQSSEVAGQTVATFENALAVLQLADLGGEPPPTGPTWYAAIGGVLVPATLTEAVA